MRNDLLDAGFVDASIRQVFDRIPDFFLDCGLLVTCLDSDPRPARAKLPLAFKTIGEFIWISPAQVEQAFKTPGMFTHFDEVFLLKNEPRCVPPFGGPFTSDGSDFSEETPQEVLSMMESVSATCYLSDGCGLNFVSDQRRSALIRATFCSEGRPERI